MRQLVAAALFVSVAAAPAQAQYTSALGGAGYSCYNSASADCFASSPGGNYIWHTGDYWQQAVASTGLATVSSVSWNFQINDYASQNFSFEVLVNGANAGSWSMPVGTASPAGDALSFAPVAGVSGDDYTVRWLITSGVCEGCGAVQITDLGRSTVTLDGSAVVATPEPASLALLATGLVGVAGFIRRRT